MTHDIHNLGKVCIYCIRHLSISFICSDGSTIHHVDPIVSVQTKISNSSTVCLITRSQIPPTSQCLKRLFDQFQCPGECSFYVGGGVHVCVKVTYVNIPKDLGEFLVGRKGTIGIRDLIP